MLKRIVVPVLLAGTAALSPAVWAQAPVEERSTGGSNNADTRSELAESASTQLYLELQKLRQEVSELRGMIESLENQVERLKSRQANDYANLDRRILELRKAGSSSANSQDGQAESTPQTAGNTEPPESDSQDATAMYNQAFANLRSGERQAALEQFDELIATYPEDPAAGDALYWKGETYWVSGSYEDARTAFVGLVDRFPDHRRYGDALYKLGLVYHQLGETDQARERLQQASELGGDVAARAQEYIEQNLTQ